MGDIIRARWEGCIVDQDTNTILVELKSYTEYTWRLRIRLTGHPNFLLYYCESELPSSGSSEWRLWLYLPKTKVVLSTIDITFTSEADVQRELALRKVFRTHCHELPLTDMFGWLGDRVPDQAQTPTTVETSVPAPIQTATPVTTPTQAPTPARATPNSGSAASNSGPATPVPPSHDR